MSLGLTRKERKYVLNRVEGMNGTQAALDAYDTDDYQTAAVISTENLKKPKIQQKLKEYGFDSDSAKSVVVEILGKEYAEDKDRLKAAEMIFKVTGDFAPEKHVNINIPIPIDNVRENNSLQQDKGTNEEN